MSKKNKSKPADERIYIPLYIPTENGAGDLVLGNGEVRGSTLIINFNDLIPAEAIKRRIQQGFLTGITFTIPEDEADAAKEREDEIQRHQDAVRAEQARLEAETPEERAARELEEEQQAAADAILLEAELARLEE